MPNPSEPVMPHEHPEESRREDRRAPAELQVVQGLREQRREVDRLARQLERSEARFRDVIERNADALLVVDGDGIIRFANQMAVRIFGKHRDELVGSILGFPIVDGDTTEVDLLVQGVPHVAEMRVVRSEWEGTPAYIASLRDITERKRAEQDARRLIREQAARVAAEESAHRMRFLLETSTVLSASLEYNATLASVAQLSVPRLADWAVVYGLDDDGHPRRLSVAHRDESTRALCRELRHLPVAPESAHPVLSVIKDRRPRLVPAVTDAMLSAMASSERELALARTLGVQSFMLVPMIARDRSLGAIAFVSSDAERHFTDDDLALAEDVAHRAALAVDNAMLYQQAQEANRTKADFLAMVSHDLRTPLTAIIGYADLLDLGIPEPMSDGSRERVNRISTSARHLLYLLNELLSFARLDSGKESKREIPIDARDVLRDVTSVIEALAAERNLSLSVRAPAAPVPVLTDPDKLRQILFNLAGNAVKYTKRGEVCITLRQRADGKSEFEVADTGDGIAKQHLERIFEPFWQVDPTQRLHGGGTGLGLSVVKRLCALLGGKLTVVSEPGRGSTFTVCLP